MNTKTGSYEPRKWSLSLVALAFFSLVEPAPAQVLPPEADNIVTVAGTHLEIGDGGPATAALFNLGGFVVFDPAGNCYITEAGGHRIRKVVPGSDGVLDGLADPDPEEIITTFAGLGGSGFNGDDIPAITAQLNAPRTAVVDLSGSNLYFAENGGHRVRRINIATGIITTVVGTGVRSSMFDGYPATTATINSPGGLCFDSSGNLYVTEVFGFRVRRVVPGANGIIDGAADEIITTVVGDGIQCPAATIPCGDGGPATAAELNQTNAVAADAAGNLYICDNLNNRIRKVTRSPDPPLGDGNVDGDMDEIITTVAGTGAVGFNGDNIPAISATLGLGARTASLDSSGNLYIADFSNRRVRFVNLGTTAITIAGQTVLPGNITTIAGTGMATGPIGDGGPATAAWLSGPNHVSFDFAGDIYITEPGIQRIRKVNRVTGIITTVAGGGIFNPHDGGPATAAQFNPSSNVAFDPSGDLYIADIGNNRIRKVDRVTGIITTVAGTGASGGGGNGGPALAAQLNGPVSIAFDSVGNLFIADNLPIRKIRKVVPGSDGVINGGADEIITVIAGGGGSQGDGGPGTAAGINLPTAIAFDSFGNLYICEFNGSRIRKLVPGADGILDGAPDEIITTIAGTGLTGGPVVDGVPATTAQLATPQAAAFDSSGNLYIADAGNNRIRKIVPGANGVIDGAADEIITTVVNQSLGTAGFSGDGGPAATAQINTPQGVAVDSSGNLYIADVGNNRVRFVNLGTTTTSISGQTVLAGDITTIVNQTPGTPSFSGDGDLAMAAQLNGPRGVSFDSAGNLHINDSANSRIRRLNVATPATVTPKELDPADPTGNWVRATIQLPADWNGSDVDIDTVMLQAIDPTDGAVRNMSGQELKVARDPGAPVTTHSHAVMLRFHRGTVLSWANGGTLELRVEGQFRVPDPGQPGQFLAIGRYFSGDTSIDIVQ